MKSMTWLLGFLGFLGLLAFLAYVAFVDTIETPYAVGGVVSVALLVAWVALDWDALVRMAQARGARYSLNALLLVAVGLGITVAVNVLAHRYDERVDLTSSKRFALSEQTRKVLAGLDQPVTLLAFFPAGSMERSELEDLLDGYRTETGQLQVSFHDPVREPMLAEQHQITSSWGTVVLKAGEATQRLESDFGEEALTNALIRVTSGEEHALCFVTGHGELDPDDASSPSGLGGAVGRLEAQNYTARSVNLVREGAVPDDCEILVVADPESDWLAPEREMAAAFVARGGAMLVMLDPGHAPGLARDLARYGLAVGDDIVIEANPKYQLVGGDVTYLVLDPQSFAPHELTADLQGMTILRLARSVGPGPEAPGVRVQTLAQTTPYGWAETTLDGMTEPAPDEGDIVGNVPLIALAEVTDPAALVVGSTAIGEGAAGGLLPLGSGTDEAAADQAAAGEAAADEAAAVAAAAAVEVPRAEGGRVLVFGDSDFATNELLDQGSNMDLFLNSLAWLAGEDDQVSIRPNPASTASLSMDLLQGLLVWLLCLLVVPGVAVAMAIATWRERRNL